VMVGYCFTAKKAADRRWASRSLLCVSMLAASTSAATQELAGFCSSIWRCPRSAWKRPLVVLTDKTRIANDRCEWVGSICQIMVILLERASSSRRVAHVNGVERTLETYFR